MSYNISNLREKYNIPAPTNENMDVLFERVQKRVVAENGRLFTTDETVSMVSEIRAEIQKEK